MKNLRVGVRIGLGFGIVIVCILMIFGVVLSTTNTSSENLNIIDLDSTLQSMVFEASNNFLMCRIQANIFFTNFDEAAYRNAINYLDRVDAQLDETIGYINQHDILAKFLPDVENLLKLSVSYHTALDQVMESSAQMRAANVEATKAGEQITTLSSKSTEYEMALLRQELSAGASAEVIANEVDMLNRAKAVDEAILSYRMNVRGYVVSNDAASFGREAERMVNKIFSAIDVYSATASATGRSMILALRESVQGHYDILGEWYTAAQRADKNMGDARSYGTTLADGVDAFNQTLDNVVTDRINISVAAANSSQTVTLAVTLIAIAIAILMTVMIIVSVTKPVKQVAEAAHNMSKGNLNINIDYQSKDEFGQLSRDMNVMIKTLSGYVSIISNTLSKMADGDLTVSVTSDFAGDFAPIKSSLNGIITALNYTLSGISEAAGMVTSGANQVSGGSQILATGATEQAASVQQLASTINELLNKTQENARSAETLNDIASKMSLSAEMATSQTNELMNAMSEIHEASSNISSVISRIDEIAFKTNLLALNASVEAAHAEGATGAGFAVVATEVRDLSVKTTKSAKESAALIETSIEKVKNGTLISENTSKTLFEIVDGINETVRLIANIANASIEQENAMNQINSGVSQISNVVQSNASTAQQSAATSEEMNSQATNLREMLMKFRLENSSPMRASSRNNVSNIKLPITKEAQTFENINDSVISTPRASEISLPNDGFGKY